MGNEILDDSNGIVIKVMILIGNEMNAFERLEIWVIYHNE